MDTPSNRMNPELDRLEKSLRSLEAAPTSEENLTKFESAMLSWKETVPVEEKIVDFPSTKNRHPRYAEFLKIAAVVAFLGTIGAWLIPQHFTSPQATTDHQMALKKNETMWVEDSSTRSVVSLKNNGIFLTGINQQPVERLQLNLIERQTFKNGKGHTIEIDSPNVQLVELPIHVD